MFWTDFDAVDDQLMSICQSFSFRVQYILLSLRQTTSHLNLKFHILAYVLIVPMKYNEFSGTLAFDLNLYKVRHILFSFIQIRNELFCTTSEWL